jgi:hypothetical protein
LRGAHGRSVALADGATRVCYVCGWRLTPGFFDPLRLSHRRTNKDLKKYREAEIKHARIAMLATVSQSVRTLLHSRRSLTHTQ